MGNKGDLIETFKRAIDTSKIKLHFEQENTKEKQKQMDTEHEEKLRQLYNMGESLPEIYQIHEGVYTGFPEREYYVIGLTDPITHMHEFLESVGFNPKDINKNKNTDLEYSRQTLSRKINSIVEKYNDDKTHLMAIDIAGMFVMWLCENKYFTLIFPHSINLID